MELAGAASVGDIVAIADGEPVVVAPQVLRTLRNVHQQAEEVSRSTPVYGRTTGVGANRSTTVERDREHGLRLLRSHAVDAGPSVPEREIRAMLGVRLNQLCHPGSGIDPDILEALARMLNEDALPTIRRFGSIGTGDLTALASTALTLIGERPATRPLTRMAPWGADSALPFLSSSALTLGQACLVASQLQQLARAAEVIYAFSFTALGGNPSSWSPEAAAAAGSPSAAAVATRLRAALLPLTTPPRRIQDPFGLRVFSLTHGEVIAAIERLDGQLTSLLQRAQENPLFGVQQVVHHGAFYQAGLGLSLDATNAALAQASTNTFARIRMSHEPSQTGQPAFLAGPPAGASGTMMVEYVAASTIAEIRNAAEPASTGTLSLSRGAEEDAPFTAQSLKQLQRTARAQEVLLSCELVVAIRLLRIEGLIPALRPQMSLAYRAVAHLPDELTDRDLREDLDLAGASLSQLSFESGPAGGPRCR
ncbi:aromatic amino acid lyase [uncultured Friedmanniella sp.]|uniref:aromatic amino acid lyase n=1 Tax=uncultured Friedmanniella sp. TaxID=335381 RepID=UPI0035C960F8